MKDLSKNVLKMRVLYWISGRDSAGKQKNLSSRGKNHFSIQTCKFHAYAFKSESKNVSEIFAFVEQGVWILPWVTIYVTNFIGTPIHVWKIIYIYFTPNIMLAYCYLPYFPDHFCKMAFSAQLSLVLSPAGDIAP